VYFYREKISLPFQPTNDARIILKTREFFLQASNFARQKAACQRCEPMEDFKHIFSKSLCVRDEKTLGNHSPLI
jgi:hypothetical protein